MHLLVLHLSDIHIQDPSDPILGRTQLIIDALCSMDPEAAHALIFVSGDIVYSGSEDQYLLAWEFLESLILGIRHRLSTNHSDPAVHVALVPGNHDCELPPNTIDARKRLVDHFTLDNRSARNPALLEACFQAQAPFFELLKAMDSQPERSATGYDIRLYYEYTFAYGSEAVRVLCCNTATLSQLHEQPSSLYFPADAVPEHGGNESLVVAMLHHPYNWLIPKSGRDLRKRLERVADVILTGHEHDSTRRTTQGPAQETSTHIEGGVLQDYVEPSKSDFNAFVFDTVAKKQTFVHFAWDGEIYTRGQGTAYAEDGSSLRWDDYILNKVRRRHSFTLRDETKNWLDDPGLTLTHRDRGVVTLKDIYVVPNLKEINTREIPPPPTLKADRVLDLFLTTNHLLITGDNQCGKTCLAKAAFRLLSENGLIPIVLDGNQRPPLGDGIVPYLENAFADQYEPAGVEAYRQLDPARRVIIIDNYDRLPINGTKRHDFLERLTRYAGKMLLFAHDLAIAVADIDRPKGRLEGVAPFKHFRVQPFNRVLRSQLIERWFLLDSEADADGADFAHKIVDTGRILDTIVGKNFVPAFPVFVLSVLQASEASTPVDTRASTHGYFYELFIRDALSRGGSTMEYDVTSSYLAFLSYQLFLRHETSIDCGGAQTIHSDFEATYDLSRPWDKLKADLVARRILMESGDQLRFKYKYVYYYFVAQYMRDHINESEIRRQIVDLSRALFVEENANILLFLAHLSKDAFILEAMMSAARELYENAAPARLEEDVAFVGELGELASTIAYEERDRRRTRTEILEDMDARDGEDDGERNTEHEQQQRQITSDIVDATIDPVVRLNGALKTLQILGQVLKNFPGSLDGETKLRIATECLGLGLRTMGTVLGLIKENEKALLHDMVSIVRETYPHMHDTEVGERVLKNIIGMAVQVSFGMTRRISSAIGSRDLTATYKRMLEATPTPAVELVHASIALDHAGRFPDEEVRYLAVQHRASPLAMTVLRYLTIQHFMMFPVEYQVMQRICEALGIPYSRMQALDRSTRLLASRGS